ncbi:hypothetical protein CYPRO_1756 [Cyclonatronum proteinivorum]|uniref:FlgD Ig-like domain-containing protein n=1 Tax=Cyclonatronum proteinivorum TaxID=1457365 RepID=A0A345UKK4_9BACT|nr:hypothetical protein [Cyclonatronum proteinivorum]AXJ01006.1 hypothetical protein CYPRO_1756 [Cyclonatronum proteinivorum]
MQLRFSVFGLLVCAWLFGSFPMVQAQITGPTPPETFNSLSQNSVSNMGAIGDSLWVGPLMMLNVNNSLDFIFPERADSIAAGPGRLFSIALAADTVFAGLGFNFQSGGSSVQTSLGFHVSTDGGLNWGYIPPPLDDETATSIRYGDQFLEAVPVIVPQQSPPYNVAFRGERVFFAGWASGIRRSLDFGQTWERLLLPPRDVNTLNPEVTYNFVFDPRLDNNFLGFSVMIDSDGYVWAGTAGGLNISENALTDPAHLVRWNKTRRSGSSSGLLGNWIIRIKENTFDGGVWMTNWIAEGSDQQGIVVTYDRGQTFTQYLIGEQIYDLAFEGERIYAAGNNGLFISPDNGQSWNQIRQISTPNGFIRANADYLSLATTTDRLWVGTTDGLASTDDGGESWQLTRVNFPLTGGNQFVPDARDTDSYAYPNPFSKRIHELVRIKFEAKRNGNARIRLFDFGMNLIRELDSGVPVTEGQTYEAVWDGTDGSGRIVANGPVFYVISVGGSETTGKILVLD